MAATFSSAADQASKLKVGHCKSIINFYTEMVVVHINHLPLIITIFGTENTNVGLILDLESSIQQTLNPLREHLINTLDSQ